MADIIYVWEDDDYYPPNYIEKMRLTHGYDFAGTEASLYYNIKTRRWINLEHPHRSSLFCTAFRVGALQDMHWCRPTHTAVDMMIWSHANKTAQNRIKWVDFTPPNIPIGIKHGIGLCGGNGHTTQLDNQDPDGSFILNHTGMDVYLDVNNFRQTARNNEDYI